MNKTIGFTIALILLTTSLATACIPTEEENITNIGNLATLEYSPTSHDFGDKYQEDPVEETTEFEIWRGGGCCELTYSLSEYCDWVEVFPLSGSSHGEKDPITVTINTENLEIGQQTCDVTISSNAGSGKFTVKVNIISGNIEPDTPSKPVGPSSGDVDVSYSYSTSTTDPNSDKVKYGWDWDGDWNVDEWDDNGGSYYDSGETVSISHTWSVPGTYKIRVKAEDTDEKQSGFSDAKTVSISEENNFPYAPTIIGPTKGIFGSEYKFFFSSIDPDDDDIYYIINWDDGSGDLKIGPYPSGNQINMSHIWNFIGSYNVKVIAEDEKGLDNQSESAIEIIKIHDAISININKFNLGQVNARIKNNVEFDIEKINWTISVKGGIFDLIDISAEDSIDKLESGKSIEISTAKNEIKQGLGFVNIIISVNINGKSYFEEKIGFVFGRIVLT